LRQRMGLRSLAFAAPPVQVPNGWETYIFRFQIASQPELPPALAQPLVLRLYSSPQGLPRLHHEFAAQERMAALDYPVARPLLLEASSDHFGGPFMLMEEVPGRTLVDLLLARPWCIVRGPARMADLHTRLHRLPTAGFPAPPEPLLGRSLTELDRLIEEENMPGLRPGLEWLCQHRPPDPERPAVLHLDFHPLNLLFDGPRRATVLDWCEWDVGDYHADVATTMILFKSVALEWHGIWQNLARWPGRFVLLYGYLEAYHKQLRLDRHRLRYYFTWAALRRLGRYGRWLHSTPQSMGCRPSLVEHLDPDGIDRLRYCFRRWSGVNVML
ncbi:MAG TPA: phosphotransferase, partial [Gemmataceae bacterium]|nr:phosphotransferase [Gemmataceae bacterium]